MLVVDPVDVYHCDDVCITTRVLSRCLMSVGEKCPNLHVRDPYNDGGVSRLSGTRLVTQVMRASRPAHR